MTQPTERRFVMEPRLDAEIENINNALDTKITNPAQEANIADGAVTSAKIANGTVTGTDIASETITSSNILNGTITGTDIAAATVTEANLAVLDYVKFDTTYAGGSTQPGMLAWDQDNETLQFQLDDHVTLQIGQEHLMRVKNASGSVAIPERTVVMFAGATGDTVKVAPAVSDGSITVNYLAGVTTEEIPADGFGFVVQLGFVNQVNTNGWPVGTILYVDPAIPGGFTDVEPAAPAWTTPVAAVTKQSLTAGRMLIRAIPGGGGGGGASVIVSDTAPAGGNDGDLWLDSTDFTLNAFYEDADGGQWVQIKANSGLAASFDTRLSTVEAEVATGGSGVIKLNPNVMTTSYTIPTGFNGMSAGPITIADGVVVTIPDGSAWSIV